MKTFSLITLLVLCLLQAAIITTGYIGQKRHDKAENERLIRKECKEKRFAYMQSHKNN